MSTQGVTNIVSSMIEAAAKFCLIHSGAVLSLPRADVHAQDAALLLRRDGQRLACQDPAQSV